MKIVDDEGQAQPHDGKSMGEVLVRGPWIVSGYFEDAEASAASVEPDGWFHTGDMATIDPDGYMQITDRRKDVIKSGGEWISSIDLENAAIAHDDVAEAAVIAIPDPRWGERPLLIVTPRPGCKPERDQLIAFLAQQFPRWMLPDDVATIDELPHTATGKADRNRQNHEDPPARDFLQPAGAYFLIFIFLKKNVFHFSRRLASTQLMTCAPFLFLFLLAVGLEPCSSIAFAASPALDAPASPDRPTIRSELRRANRASGVCDSILGRHPPGTAEANSDVTAYVTCMSRIVWKVAQNGSYSEAFALGLDFQTVLDISTQLTLPRTPPDR